jgi:hypothetical protein
MAYAAIQLEPHRLDYVETFLGDYLMASADYQLIEGQHVPVVPMWAGKLAQENPEEEKLMAWSHMFTQWKMKQRENVKLTIKKEEKGLETLEVRLR